MEGEIIYSNKIEMSKKNKKIEISMYCQNCKLFETCTELKHVSCINYKPIKRNEFKCY